MAVVEGLMRIIGQDASGMRRDVLFEARTEVLDVSTDPRQQIYVPIHSLVLEEDDKLALEFKGDTAGTFDEGSTFRIPVSIQNKRTGVVRETYLYYGDFGLSTTNQTQGTNWTPTTSAYTINAQERLRLGHATAVNSRIYVALVLSS
jgi:hypothetical protein